MGGYGALKIALRENDSFCAGEGPSSVADIVGRSQPKGGGFIDFRDVLQPICGEEMHIPAEDDLFRLAEAKVKEGVNLPKLYMCCGSGDLYV